MAATFWTHERNEALIRLWGEGWSAGQIAKYFGMKVSRCAVIGKVHRLGLEGRKTNQAFSAKAVLRDAPKKPEPPPPPQEPEPLGKPGEHIYAKCCRWIHGDARTGRTCGHPGYPWCDHHRSRVYVKPNIPLRAPRGA